MFKSLFDQEWLLNVNKIRNQVIAEQAERKAILKGNRFYVNKKHNLNRKVGLKNGVYK